MTTNLQIELAASQKNPLILKNPVLTASGTFGFGVELTRLAEVPRLGGIVCNGITRHSRSSHHAAPALETSAGLLYSPDLPNPGVQMLRKKYAPTWSNWQTPVIVNIIADTLDDLSELAETLETISGIAALELNPLSADGRSSWQSDLALFSEAVSTLRYSTTLPLIIKLSPISSDLPPLAQAAIEAGADALSLIHSLPAIAVNPAMRKRQFSTSLVLSGPAIKPLALRLFAELARALRSTYPHVPLIGIGGIATVNDALEYLMLGASAIQVGSISFTHPRAAVEIVEGLEAFFQQEGLSSLEEIRGIAL